MDQDELETAERLHAILESAVDGILAIDSMGIIEYVNSAAIALFGFEREALIGANISMLMSRRDREKHDEYLARYARTGEARVIGVGREVTGRRKDGTEFPLHLAVSEGTHRGRTIFTGFVRDLTELRLAEERAKSAEQLASLSIITAGIAHDIGTPMNVILGYADMLRESLVSAKDRRRAEIIAEQVRRVTDLLQTILNIARPLNTLRSELQIVDVLDHALEFFREKLAKRGIEVERDFASVPNLMGDRDRLEQMFLNLIMNAADAMPKGGKLSVTVRPLRSDEVRIVLADTGQGMEPETLAHIFEPFYSTKERGKGTGLGLVVAKTIVSDHHGSIEAESDPGQGTRFVIRLPIAAPHAPEA